MGTCSRSNKTWSPSFYKTKSGKVRNNAADYAFYKHIHSRADRSASGYERASLKYNETAIAPNHLLCRSKQRRPYKQLINDPRSGDFNLDDMSHLMITEGVVGKATLGNVIFTVTMQDQFLAKYNHYLPIHIYDHQTGQHRPIPEENLKFLYMLQQLLPVFSQKQLDEDFYYLLKEEGQDKFTSLTTPEGILKACHRILNEENLQSALNKATSFNGSSLQLKLILKHISPQTLSNCGQSFKLRLQSYVSNDNELLELFSSLENTPLNKLAFAVTKKNIPTIKLIIGEISSHDLKACSKELASDLRQLAFDNKEFSLMALFDKKIGDYRHLYTSNSGRYRTSKPAAYYATQIALQTGNWDQVLEIASLREKYNPLKYRTFNEYRHTSGSDFNYLGYALLHAAVQSRWDIVKELIEQQQMTHYDFHNGGEFTIDLAIKANRLDIVILMDQNQRPNPDMPAIEQCVMLDGGKTTLPPLHNAMLLANREHIVVYLLQQKADFNSILALDKNTPGYCNYISLILQHAKKAFTPEQVDLLLKNLAELNNIVLIDNVLRRQDLPINPPTRKKYEAICKNLSAKLDISPPANGAPINNQPVVAAKPKAPPAPINLVAPKPAPQNANALNNDINNQQQAINLQPKFEYAKRPQAAPVDVIPVIPQPIPPQQINGKCPAGPVPTPPVAPQIVAPVFQPVQTPARDNEVVPAPQKVNVQNNGVLPKVPVFQNDVRPFNFQPILLDKADVLSEFDDDVAADLNLDKVEKRLVNPQRTPLAIPTPLPVIAPPKNIPIPTYIVDSPKKDSRNTISMMVLGGFIAAIGITALAIGFAVLNVITLGAASLTIALGGAVALGGLGMLGFFGNKYRKEFTSEPAIIPQPI